MLGDIRRIPWADVATIDTKDRNWNGAMNGAAIGGVIVGVTAALATSRKAAVAYAVVGAGLGTGVGAYFDSLREGRRRLYVAAASLSVVPLLSRRTADIAGVARW